MTSLRYMTADAFGSRRFTGNQVAAVFGADDLDADLMQQVAREFGYSETTFLSTARDRVWPVRIFTPVNELPFAGHPLLGTAGLVAEAAGVLEFTFATQVAHVPVVVDSSAGNHEVTMAHPVPTWTAFDRVPQLLAALGVASASAPVEIYTNGPRHVLVLLDDLATLSALTPDHHALAAFEDLAVNCVAPDPAAGWRNRMFSPAYGVVEDAATGSVAGPIAIHLARHGLIAPDAVVSIDQGVEMGRPSRMTVRVTHTPAGVTAVEVSGRSIVVTSGVLYV